MLTMAPRMPIEGRHQPLADAARLDRGGIVCNPLHRVQSIPSSSGRGRGAQQHGGGPMSAPRIANAPLSYGAFEMTVGTSFPVPAGERVLAEVTAARHEGGGPRAPGFPGG